MTQKKVKLSDQVRQAVKATGASRYAICKMIGMDQAVMSRFMTGKGGLAMENLDALAEVLGLRIVTDGPTKPLPPRRLGRPRKGR